MSILISEIKIKMTSKSKVDFEDVCDICLDSQEEEGDALIKCSQCLVSVHQHCYGSKIADEFIPDGKLHNWTCKFSFPSSFPFENNAMHIFI